MTAWELLIAPISALAGVWISPLLSARKDRKAWLWSKQFEAASAVTSTARAVLYRGDEIDPSRRDQTIEEQRQAVRLAMFALREQLTQIELVFKGSVADAARDLEGTFGNHLVPHFDALTEKASGSSEQVAEARKKLVSFKDAARSHFLK